jgi:hypothetical protein
MGQKLDSYCIVARVWAAGLAQGLRMFLLS